MKVLVSVILMIFILGSCKKDNAERSDWVIVDPAGNDLGTISDKTEQELIDYVKSGAAGCFNGVCNGYVLQRCDYFRVGDPVYCWKNGSNYIKTTEKRISCYSPSAQRVDNCIVSESWYSRKKMIYVPAGTITYSSVTFKIYTTADTINLFNSSQQIVLTNTADSFNTLQRSKTGSDFH